mgnify:CR=1 FL=1
MVRGLSNTGLLAMERVEGCRPTDGAAVRDMGATPVAVALGLLEAFAECIFLHGYVHGDLHPGNVIVAPKPETKAKCELVLIDHGLHVAVPRDFRAAYCRLWNALAEGDEADGSEEELWEKYQVRKQIEEQQEEIRRLQEEREQLTPTEKGELDQAIRDLDNAFPDLVGSPREFVITGNAYTKTLGHVDKSFALRLGIDVTKKKRIKVNVLERLRSNYVGLELTDHKDMYCEAALKISNHRDTKGQWVIASVNPGVKDWHKYENCLLYTSPSPRDKRQSRMPSSA